MDTQARWILLDKNDHEKMWNNYKLLTTSEQMYLMA